MERATIPTALLFAVLVAGCGDDGPEESISTRGEWCSVAEEVDEHFLAADTDGEPFEDRQATYAQIVDSIDRLQRGLEHVDDDARGDVESALAGAQAIAQAYVDADDEQDAATALEPIFAEYQEPVAAAAWIEDNCGVDISG